MKVIINYQEYPHIEAEKKLLRDQFPGIEIVESKTIEESEFIREAQDSQGALVQFAPITPRVIDSLTSCRGYVRYGIGYDNIDAQYAKAKGKMVANVQRYCLDEVANHALALVLALNRRLVTAHNLVSRHQYDFEKMRPINRLAEATVGIVGIGKIGGCFADKIKTLVKNVIFADPNVFAYPGAKRVSLQSLFREADYISLHVPLNENTRHMIDAPLLAMMKPNAFLINTSRGPVIDEPALIHALRLEKIAGVGLDVFETEPLPANNPLADLPNVILTHHTAWYSEDSIAELQRKGAEQLVSILKGQIPEFAV